MAVTGHFIIYYVAQVWGPGRSVLLTAVLYASADFHDWQILHGHLGHWWPQMASAYTTQCVVLATWPTALTSNFKSSMSSCFRSMWSTWCVVHSALLLLTQWLSDAGSTKPEFAKNDRRRTGWINQNITWGAPHYRKIFGQKTSARLRICSPIIPSTFKTCRILRSPVRGQVSVCIQLWDGNSVHQCLHIKLFHWMWWLAPFGTPY